MKIEVSIEMPEVCEIGLAREILYRAGFSARRDSDYLIVFSDEQKTGFYKSEHYDEKPVARLYIDEGSFGNCLQNRYCNGGKIDAILGSAIWYELVDWTELLAILVKKFAPNAEIAESPVSGRGSSKRHYASEYMKALSGVKMAPDYDEILFV